jgi:ribosome maturation factor RimP
MFIDIVFIYHSHDFFFKILSIKYYCLILRRNKCFVRGQKSPILLAKQMINKEKIREILGSEMESEGIIFVDIQVHPGNKIHLVIDSTAGISIDQCVKYTKLFENSFDRETEDYELEVSSYGIGEPFILPLHFKKNLGKMVEVFRKKGKTLAGILKGYDFKDEKLEYIQILVKQKVQLEGKKRKTEIEEELRISADEIQKTRLLLVF